MIVEFIPLNKVYTYWHVSVVVIIIFTTVVYIPFLHLPFHQTLKLRITEDQNAIQLKPIETIHLTLFIHLRGHNSANNSHFKHFHSSTTDLNSVYSKNFRRWHLANFFAFFMIFQQYNRYDSARIFRPSHRLRWMNAVSTSISTSNKLTI